MGVGMMGVGFDDDDEIWILWIFLDELVCYAIKSRLSFAMWFFFSWNTCLLAAVYVCWVLMLRGHASSNNASRYSTSGEVSIERYLLSKAKDLLHSHCLVKLLPLLVSVHYQSLKASVLTKLYHHHLVI